MNHSKITLTFISMIILETVIPIRTEDQRLKNYVRLNSWYISPTAYQTYYISNTNTATKNGIKISNFSLLTFHLSYTMNAIC